MAEEQDGLECRFTGPDQDGFFWLQRAETNGAFGMVNLGCCNEDDILGAMTEFLHEKGWIEPDEEADSNEGDLDAPSVEAQPASQDHRVSRRVELSLDAEIRKSGGSFVSVPVLDLSTHGFRIESPLWLKEGSDLWLRLPGLEARHAKTAWVRGAVSGCAFVEPLHEAVLDLIISRGRTT